MPNPTINYNGLAADYARNRHVHPGVIRSLIDDSGIGEGAAVLEVGCGTGNYITALESLVRCAGWGIDPSEAMLAKARARPTAVRFRPGRAERLEFDAASFDLVFSVDVIHHVADRAEYFRQAHRVLRPSGALCTVTDSEWIIRRREPLSVYFPETAEADLARYPRTPDLTAMMRAAGFRRLEESMVEFRYEIYDSRPYRERAFSALHLIPPQAFARGLERMERDLARGPIPCVSRYVLLWGRF